MSKCGIGDVYEPDHLMYNYFTNRIGLHRLAKEILAEPIPLFEIESEVCKGKRLIYVRDNDSRHAFPYSNYTKISRSVFFFLTTEATTSPPIKTSHFSMKGGSSGFKRK